MVTLAILTALTAALDGRDSDLAEAVIALLSRLATNPEPPKGLVREAVRWLGRKVDIFLEEAAKTSGKIVGGALVGVAAFQLSKYPPELSEQVARLIDLAD